jgi:sugar transferase (PEP-CTERM/EpsH1 system associated)
MSVAPEILFIAHRVPFPPDRGDKIRSHHVLKRLVNIAPVHVATFADNEADLMMEGELAAATASHCLAQREQSLLLAGGEALLLRRSVSAMAFRSHEISDYVARTIATRPIQAIYVFSGQMGMYIPESWTGRTIVDLVDVDSAKLEAYAKKAGWLTRWIYRREARLLAAEEERLARLADLTLLVSEQEANLLRGRMDDLSGTEITVMRNGIDARHFDPIAVSPHRELDGMPGPHIVFTGQMDYPPNISAALRIIRHILPAIRKTHPMAMFHCVGRSPVSVLTECDMSDGVRIWGEVPDVRPFLKSADLVLVPLEIARGVQNKVLEAMAMECPVLLTECAATGIGAEPGVHYRTAGSDEALISSALALIADRQAAGEMSRAARRFVVEDLGWDAMLKDLPAMLGMERGGSEDSPGTGNAF